MAPHFFKRRQKAGAEKSNPSHAQRCLLHQHLLLERGWLVRSAVPLAVMLVFSLMLGAVFYVTIGPMSLPDPGMHVREIYALATGHAFDRSEGYTDSAGNEMTAQYINIDTCLLKSSRNNTVSEIVQLPNSSDTAHKEQIDNCAEWSGKSQRIHRRSQYFPLTYGVQTLAFGITSAAGGSPYLSFQAARLANLLVTIVLEAIAIVLLPRGKMIFALICALPSTVFLAVSISMDAAIPAFVMLLLAASLRALEHGKMTNVLAVMCGVSAMALFFLKTAFVFTVLVPLMLPESVLSRRRKLIVALAVAIPSILVYLWWKSLVNFTTSPLYNMAENLTWIKSHVLLAATRVATSMARLPFWVCKLPTRSVVGVLIILATTLFCMRNVARDEDIAREGFVQALLYWRMPLCGVLCFLLSCLAMCYTFMVSWNEMGSATAFLEGWQERYFLPLLPLLVLFLYPVTKRHVAEQEASLGTCEDVAKLSEDVN